MNANNFQQFVSSNKGKLITFKHQGADISKYVVDVSGEYFTAKKNQTDVKIDGFYYFSDCEMYKPTLIETLATHKYVVLVNNKHTMRDVLFEYEYYIYVNDTLMIAGRELSKVNIEVPIAASYIGEVWATVDGKFTKVWEPDEGVNNYEIKKIKINDELTDNGYICITDLTSNIKTNILIEEYLNYIDVKDSNIKKDFRLEFILKNGKKEGESKCWYPNGQLYYQCSYKEGKLEGEFIMFWDSGFRKKQTYYKEGKKEGECKEWYPKGAVVRLSYYKDNKLEGEWKQWWDNGQLGIECYYKEGKKDGKYKEWYNNKIVYYETYYNEDVLEGEYKKWNENGKLIIHKYYKEGKLEGEYKEYDNGYITIKCYYKEGKLEGEYKKWWSSNGKLRMNTSYNQGKINGEYKSWYEKNGKIDTHCYYNKDGKLDGIFKQYYYRDGGKLEYIKNLALGDLVGDVLVRQCYYKEGKKEGEYKEWWNNGKLKCHCYYKEDKKEGEYREWNSDGFLITHYLYKNNKIVQQPPLQV